MRKSGDLTDLTIFRKDVFVFAHANRGIEGQRLRFAFAFNGHLSGAPAIGLDLLIHVQPSRSVDVAYAQNFIARAKADLLRFATIGDVANKGT